MSEGQLEDVARVCNRYPTSSSATAAGRHLRGRRASRSRSTAQLERELEGDLRPVDAPRCSCG